MASDIPSIDFCLEVPFSLDELKVLSACTGLRKKENWRQKVLNEEIAQKWKTEAVEQNGFAEDLADWLIARLQWEASNPIPSFNNSTILPTAAPGVFESTDLIDPDLKQEFKQGFDKLLGSISSGKRDYHPGTDDKVLNLIHPSLYPYVQDRTPMFPFSEKLDIEEKGNSDVYSCFKNSVKTRNQAKISNALEPEFSILSKLLPYHPDPVKVKFQWIPTDFKVSSDKSVKFLGYINNLHPQPESSSGKLYPVLEKVLSKFIPLFESVLSEFPVKPTMKHEAWSWGYDPPRPEYGEDEEDGAFEERNEQWENEAKFLPPKVEPFEVPQVERFELGGKNLQVIVKMASVELSPEKPDFEGGKWHVEGTGREKICATGIYYFENENIELPTLSFRAPCEDEDCHFESPMSDYEQGEFEHFTDIYGQTNLEPRLSYLNSVQTEDGKCIAFSNGIQHRLSGFSLKDKTKRGHRRFLVFFLVDPTQRIPSTTEIPPQQSQWIFDEVDGQTGTHLSKLPIEMREVLYTSVDALSSEKKVEVASEETSAAKVPESQGSDPVPYMSHEEALRVRLELMKERSNHAQRAEEAIKEATWNWCEH